MRQRGAGIQHSKLRGEWAELCFMVRVAEHGLRLSKPWGECAHYDFVVEAVGRFLRVQVKSTTIKRGNGYVCAVRDCRGNAYEDDAFDFLAVYVIPLDVWYIIPAEKTAGQESVYLHPKRTGAKYDSYREAWHLLRDAGAVARIDSIEACAEESAPFMFADLMLPYLGEDRDVPRLLENLTS